VVARMGEAKESQGRRRVTHDTSGDLLQWQIVPHLLEGGEQTGSHDQWPRV
jgi:hypothetical protein